MPEKRKNKFVAQKEKEERQKKIILYGTIAIMVIVVGLVAYGLLQEQVFQPKKTIIELGDYQVTASEFEQRVRYQRLNLINQAYQMYQFGMQDYIAQIATQLQPLLVGQTVIDQLTDELIIRIEAEERGISLSEEEIEEEIQKVFGYYEGGTPTAEPTQEALVTSTLTAQQLTLIPDTPTPTTVQTEEVEGDEGAEDPAPTMTEVVEEEAEEEEEEPVAQPTATPLLRPTEYTFEMYQQNYQEALNNLQEQIQMDEQTFRNLIRAYILRQRLTEEITADINPTPEHVWARHILVEDQETAQELYDRLQEGESFAELAQEYSIDTSNSERGGDLGWFTYDQMVEPFADAAFSLEIEEISQPVQTDFGWHLIQVIGNEERQLAPNQIQQMKQQQFQEWLAEKREEYDPEVAEDWLEFTPSQPALPPELQQVISQEQAPAPGTEE
jgi:parvulin-like peptidyl-prolyl isomerase